MDDKINLILYSDCCYSGMWQKLYGGYDEGNGIQTKCEGWIHGFSACDFDEVAHDGYFSNLIKGKKPDYN